MFTQEFEKVAAKDKEQSKAKRESKKGYSILEGAMNILMQDDAQKNQRKEEGAREKVQSDNVAQAQEAQADQDSQVQNQAAQEAQHVDAQQAGQQAKGDQSSKKKDAKPKDKKEAPPAAGGANVHVHVNGAGEEGGKEKKYAKKDKKK